MGCSHQLKQNFLNGLFAGFLGFIFYCSTSNASEQFSSDISVIPSDNMTCLEGWLPSANTGDNHCLRISTCVENNILSQPTLSPSECPAELNNTRLDENHFQAVVKARQGNQIFREVINQHSNDTYDLSAWTPFFNQTWNAANTSMFALHLWKVMDKLKKFYQGKVTSKNISFFGVYLVGAAWHLLDTPWLAVSKAIPFTAHYLFHAVKLPLSLLARRFDCSCCSQVKNGHNIMVAFNTLVLTLMTIKYAIW